MQLAAWRLKLPKLCSRCRNSVIFDLLCMRVTKFSSFWPPINVCTFRPNLTNFGQHWMQLDAWRLEWPKTSSLWQTLVVFALFCMRVTKVSSFWPPINVCTIRPNLTNFGQHWMQLDAWSLEWPKTSSLWQTLVVFALFCMRVTKVISFWPPTKICTFRQNLTYFGQKGMQLENSILKSPKKSLLWRTLVISALFCMRFTKVTSFWPSTKVCTLRPNLRSFG